MQKNAAISYLNCIFFLILYRIIFDADFILKLCNFRYRAKDAWKAVTRIAIREARLKEIKQEVMNCEKLKSYFEDNPRDLKSLRQDKTLHTVKLQPHLKDVPEYIVPPTLKKIMGIGKRKRKFDRDATSATHTKSRHLARTSNPLISLQISNK